MDVIEITNLSLSLQKKDILKEVSLHITSGEIFGLLGRNGSGKSTLIKILAGLTSYQKGQVKVFHKPLEDRESKKKISFVFQENSLDERLTVFDNLLIAAVAYGIPSSLRPSKIERLLKFMDLEERKNDKVIKLSGGLKRRLDLARAFLNEPKLLVLDEPTTGLDEISFREIWNYIKKLNKEYNVTVLLSTHKALEAQTCHRLAIIEKGHIAKVSTPELFKKELSKDLIYFELPSSVSSEEVCTTLERELKILRPSFVKGVYYLETDEGAHLIPEILKRYPDISSISLKQPDIADAFLKFTGEVLSSTSKII
jgi:ABC-2 type transport system ATP-binding protein